MSIKIISTNHILNSNNQEIFKFPGQSLLDKILPELWPTIIDYYYHNQPFVIGDRDKQYPGFRLITQQECETDDFDILFHMHLPDGLYAMDNIEFIEDHGILYNTTDWVCGYDFYKSYLKCDKYIRKGKMVNFTLDFCGMHPNSKIVGVEYERLYCEIGLFIADQIRLY